MNILVTGAAGFIGSNMVDRLLKDGHHVVGIDNLTTGMEANLPNDFDYKKKILSRFKFYKFDLTNKTALDLVLRENKIDAVMHFAGNASIVNAMTNPTSDVQNNIITTMNVVNSCVENKIPRLLHASTMVVYGQDNVSKKETDPCVPTSTYGLTKYAGERYVMNAGDRTDLDFQFNVTTFRMFNVYGPKQDINNPYQGVVAIFTGLMRKKQDIILHGDGSQTRDFIFIDDVIDAWVSSLNNPKTYGQVFNLGSGEEITIRKIAEAVFDAMDANTVFKGSIINQPVRQGDIKRCLSDSNKLRKAIKWKPKVSFQDGLEKFVKFVRA